MIKKKIVMSLALLAGIAPAIAETVEERLDRQEKEIAEIRQQLREKGNSSGLGFPEWFSLNGEWEFEYVDTQTDEFSATKGNSQPHWQHDKFLLKPKITLSKNLYMKGELEFARDTARIEEFHAHFTGLPLDSQIILGFDERFSKADKGFDMADRKTESYPLIGTAFWRDEMYSIQWGGKTKTDAGMLKDVFWRVHWGDGLALDDRDIGEDDAPGNAEITHDNDQLASGSGLSTLKNKKELGFGLGFTFEPTKNYKFDIAGWILDSELHDDGDKGQLTNIVGYSALDPQSTITAATDDTMTRIGYRTTHKFKSDAGETMFVYEYAEAEDGKLERYGNYGQLSHKFKFKPLIGGEFLNSIEPLVRFEDYHTNLARSFTGNGYGETWDRKQEVYALLLGLVSNNKLKATLKLEYLMNEEKTGAIPGNSTQENDPDNDEFLAQFEFKF